MRTQDPRPTPNLGVGRDVYSKSTDGESIQAQRPRCPTYLPAADNYLLLAEIATAQRRGVEMPVSFSPKPQSQEYTRKEGGEEAKSDVSDAKSRVITNREHGRFQSARTLQRDGWRTNNMSPSRGEKTSRQLVSWSVARSKP